MDIMQASHLISCCDGYVGGFITMARQQCV